MKIRLDILSMDDSLEDRVVASMGFESVENVLIIGSVPYEDIEVEDLKTLMRTVRAIQREVGLKDIDGLPEVVEQFVEGGRSELAPELFWKQADDPQG